MALRFAGWSNPRKMLITSATEFNFTRYMFRPQIIGTLFMVTVCAFSSSAWAGTPGGAPPGWGASGPRDEIKPRFEYEARGGVDRQGACVIRGAGVAGEDGCWTRSFSIEGGKFYRFSA